MPWIIAVILAVAALALLWLSVLILRCYDSQKKR